MTVEMGAAAWTRGVGLMLVLACAWPVVAAASPFVAFAPGHEAEILALFEPFQPDHPIGDVAFASVQIGSNTITAQVTAAGGAEAKLVLTARATEPPRNQQSAGLAPSASFDLALQPAAADPRLAAVLAQLAERVRLHDPGGLVQRWTRSVAAPDSQPARAERHAAARAWLGAAAILWLVALASLVVLAAAALRRRPAHLGVRIGVLLAVAVVAAAARWHAPLTLLHCNNHGIEDLRAVLAPDLAAQPRLVLRYGPSFFGPQAWLAHAMGGGETAVFLASVGVGSLAAVVTAAATWLWTAGLWAGLVGGLLVAVLPLAVRVGHSESSLVFGQLCIALMLLAAGARLHLRGSAESAERPAGTPARVAADLLLGTATLLTTTGHTFGPGYAVAILVVVAEALIGARLGARALVRSLAWFTLPVGAFALLLAGADGSNRDRLAAATLSEASPFKPWAHLLWFDPTWTPWVGQALFVVGLLRFWHAGAIMRRVAVLPGLALLAGLALFIGGSVSVALRYQALLAPVWALVAAATLIPIGARGYRAGGRRHRLAIVGTTGLAVAALASLVTARSAYQFADLEAQVYAALRPVVPTLPDGAVVLVPDRQGTPDQEIIIDFPDFLAAGVSQHLTVAHLGEWHRLQRETVAARPPAVYAWRSHHCQARARVVGRWPDGRDATGLPLREVCRPLVELASLPGARVVAQGRHPAPRENPDRLPDEYHQYAGSAIVWSLVQLPAGAEARQLSPQPARP